MGWKKWVCALVQVLSLAVHPVFKLEQWIGVAGRIQAFVIVAGIIGAGAVGAWAPSPLPETSPRWLAVVGYPAVVSMLLFFWVGIRLQVRLVDYETPKLLVELNKPSNPSAQGDVWINLLVTNLSGNTVPRVFGKIESYECITNPQLQDVMPRVGTDLTWSTHAQKGGDTERDITTQEILDVAFVSPALCTTRFFTPRRNPSDPNTIRPSFPLPAGTYRTVIHVGSHGARCRVERVEVTIAYKGGQDLTGSVRNLAPRKPGSQS